MTAVFAFFQQRAQGERENERLDKQLAHDRQLHDLDAFRALIDDVSSLMWAEVRAVARLGTLMRGRTGPITGELFENASAVVDTAIEKQREWTALAGKMLVHMSEDDDIFSAAANFMSAMEECTGAFLDDVPAEELRERLGKGTAKAGGHARAFREAAREEIAFRGGGA